MPPDVTLDDVARAAAVSRATASRALNDRSGVKPDVKRRVEAAAELLGYRPNRAARNLAGGRMAVIGMAINGQRLRDSYYQNNLLSAVAAEADRRDEGLMILTSTESPSEVAHRILTDRLVDGLIISIGSVPVEWAGELLDADIPTVLIGFHPDRNNTTVVEVENTESSAQLVGHLLDTGCHRVGTMTGTLSRADAQERLAGYRLAHERRGLPVDDSLIVEGTFYFEQAFDRADQLLENGVDGIFAANDSMATGIYQRAVDRGFRIPDDLSLAGFDGYYLDPIRSGLSRNRHRLTSAVFPFDKVAAQAVTSLLEAIDGGMPPNRIVPPTIFYGDTTRAPVSG